MERTYFSDPAGMSRTSPSQFEVMVDFMERNGDLNKPADGPHGRLTSISKWQELINCLNLDATGTSKTMEKWKKVWSDLKNNTKRKAARIHHSVVGTGGGPATKLVLTDLEQRILSIIGPQAVTGLLDIEEVGLEQVGHPQPSTGQPETSLLESHTPFQVDVQVESIVEDWNRPGGSSQSTPFPTEVVEAGTTSPTAHHAQSPPRNRRVVRGSRSTPAPAAPRRSRPPTQRQHVDAASDQFLSSDEQWRNLATEFVAEHVRLREVELQQHAQWQTLFGTLLEVLHKLLNK